MTVLLLAVIYLAFISLGLPDSLLGSAWPSMYEGMHASITGAGTLAMLISGCTIVSSLLADRMIHRFGTHAVTTVSVGMTAAALFGFSISTTYAQLVLWCLPYGLGAGAVDSALNNYVALHYSSRHMSWLHCMWGIGASIGPYVMGYCLTHMLGWQMGYRIIGTLQSLLRSVGHEIYKDPYSVVVQMQSACVLTILPLIILFVVMQSKFTESIDKTGIVG